MKIFDHSAGDTLEVDGAQLFYAETGRPDGHPVLLLHGGFGTMQDFNGLLPHLHERYRVIALDSRGHGQSTLGHAELSYERLQRDAEALLRHLELAEFSIVGFSDGGIVALRLAALSELAVTKVAVIGTSWRLEGGDVKDILGRVTAESWKQKFPETCELYQRLNPEPDFERLVPAAVRMWLDESRAGHPGEAVREIAVPLLVARGDTDHLVSRQHSIDLADKVPHAAFLNVPFAGHALMDDQGVLLATILNDFLEWADLEVLHPDVATVTAD